MDTTKRERTLQYAKMNANKIKELKFKCSDLVLMQNSQIESSLNMKMKP